MVILLGAQLRVRRLPAAPEKRAYVNDIVVEVDADDRLWVVVLLSIRDEGNDPDGDADEWVPVHLLNMWVKWASQERNDR